MTIAKPNPTLDEHRLQRVIQSVLTSHAANVPLSLPAARDILILAGVPGEEAVKRLDEHRAFVDAQVIDAANRGNRL